MRGLSIVFNRMGWAASILKKENTVTSRQKIRASLLGWFPIASRLTRDELAFAVSLAERHEAIKIYSNGQGIFLSREAMYTPLVREVFFLREYGVSKKAA
jgi:hypothetical protein